MRYTLCFVLAVGLLAVTICLYFFAEPSNDDDKQTNHALPNSSLLISFEMLQHKDRGKVVPSSVTTPPDIRKADGKYVTISGYLSPCKMSLQRYFILASTPILDTDSTQLLDDFIAVSLANEWKIGTPVKRVRVTGIFLVKEEKDKQGRGIGLYHLSNAVMQVEDN